MNKRRQPIPLKKYNKVLSIIIKDYKQKGTPYTIAEARTIASLVYQKVKKYPPSKITKKKALSQAKIDEKIKLEATDVPNYWFDAQDQFIYYFRLGDWVNQFANAYPKIPVMIITKKHEKTPLVVQGAEGDYDGSIFQRWVEDIRSELSEPENYDEMGYFFGTPAYFDGKLYATWYEDGVTIPKVAPPVTQIEPRKQILIERAEEIEKRRREIEKPKKKRGRPKKTEEDRKKPLPKKKREEKKKPIEKPTPNRVTEIRNLIGDLIKREETLIYLVKSKLMTKSEFKKQQKQISDDISDLTRKLEKGGKI